MVIGRYLSYDLEYNNRSVIESIRQINIVENGIINFGRESHRENAQRYLYIDDLFISSGSLLKVTNWKEGRDFLLIRKESAHLQDALKKMEFAGYDRNAIHLVDYNKDYWSISSTPESTTYGAIFAALGVSIVIYRRKQREPFKLRRATKESLRCLTHILGGSTYHKISHLPPHTRHDYDN